MTSLPSSAQPTKPTITLPSTPRQVEAAFAAILSAWTGGVGSIGVAVIPGNGGDVVGPGNPVWKETEQNWESRDRAMLSVRHLVPSLLGSGVDTVGSLAPSTYHGVKSLLNCFLSALASLRTALVMTTCTTLAAIAAPLHSHLDPTFTEPLILALFKLSGSSKKLLITASSSAVSQLIQYSAFNIKILSSLVHSLSDKNVNVRAAAATLIQSIMHEVLESKERRSHFNRQGGPELLERGLGRGLLDAGGSVRESMRNIYCTLEHCGFWKELLGKVMYHLEPTAKKALLKFKASWKPSAKITKKMFPTAASLDAIAATSIPLTMAHFEPSVSATRLSVENCAELLLVDTRRSETLSFMRDHLSTTQDHSPLSFAIKLIPTILEDGNIELDTEQLNYIIDIYACLGDAMFELDLVVPLLGLLYKLPEQSALKITSMLCNFNVANSIALLDSLAVFFTKPNKARRDKFASDTPFLTILMHILSSESNYHEQVVYYFKGKPGCARPFILRLVSHLQSSLFRNDAIIVLQLLHSLDAEEFNRVLGTFDPDVSGEARRLLSLPEEVEETGHNEKDPEPWENEEDPAPSEHDSYGVDKKLNKPAPKLPPMNMDTGWIEARPLPLTSNNDAPLETPSRPRDVTAVSDVITVYSSLSPANSPALMRHDSKLLDENGDTDVKKAKMARKLPSSLEIPNFNPSTPSAPNQAAMRKRVYNDLFSAATPVQRQPPKGSQDLDQLISQLEDYKGSSDKGVLSSTIRKLYRLAKEDVWVDYPESFERCWHAIQSMLILPSSLDDEEDRNNKPIVQAEFVLLVIKEWIVHQKPLFQGREEELIILCLECLSNPSVLVSSCAYDIVSSMPHNLDSNACMKVALRLVAELEGDETRQAYLFQLVLLLLRSKRVVASSELRKVLQQGINSPYVEVRKICVDCFVQLRVMLSKEKYTDYLKVCTDVQRKIIQLYIGRERSK